MEGTSSMSSSAQKNHARRISRAIVNQMANFVGVEESEKHAIKWENRRKRYAQSMGGELKPQFSNLQFVEGSGASQSRAALILPYGRKQSVIEMTLHGLSTTVRHKHMADKPPMRPERGKARGLFVSPSVSAFETDRRLYGVGVVGRLLGRRLTRSAITKAVKAQLDDLDDHRPFFTYWITCVQTVVFIVAAAVYGLAPVGIGKSTERQTIRLSSLAREVKEYTEPRNVWIGPRQMDLIHLGARYSPCMRVDPNLKTLLEMDRKKENESACCVRNDGAGCVQRVKAQCDILSTWKKWTADKTGPSGRLSGSVCGQDPSYCKTPSSADPFQWPDSIVDWPLCTDSRTQNLSKVGSHNRHMSCDILGRPCCFGIRGECWITTREHCDLLRGRFHDDKFLCSQTFCFQQICGMLPFSKAEKPDQVYRLWTSLFLHAGLLHLAFTIVFQMLIMRDIEKLTGALRLSIIYIGSGIAGNLASCTFIPYIVDAGPSGAQFGVMACLLVEVLQSYQMYRNPYIATLKLFALFIALFICGLMPWFDNWAHIFGFTFGFLMAFALLPYVSFGKFDRRRKILTLVICLGIAKGLFVVLIIVFYVAPITECKFCKYLNCIPITLNFCEDMDISLSNRSSYDTNI